MATGVSLEAGRVHKVGTGESFHWSVAGEEEVMADGAVALQPFFSADVIVLEAKSHAGIASQAVEIVNSKATPHTTEVTERAVVDGFPGVIWRVVGVEEGI